MSATDGLTGAYFRGRENGMSVAVWRRIVRHLEGVTIEYYGITVAPRKATQDGISEALGVSRAHVAVNLLRMRKRGWIDVRLAHVSGMRRMKKVYCLSSAGREAARNAVSALRSWG